MLTAAKIAVEIQKAKQKETNSENQNRRVFAQEESILF